MNRLIQPHPGFLRKRKGRKNPDRLTLRRQGPDFFPLLPAQGFDALGEDLNHSLLQFFIGQVFQDLSGNGVDLHSRQPAELVKDIRPLQTEGFEPSGLDRVDLLPDLLHQLPPIGVGVRPGLIGELLGSPCLFHQALLILRGFLAGLLPALLRLGENRRDLGLPGIHGVDDPAVEKFLQQKKENQEIDDLGEKDKPVDVHGSPPRLLDDVGPEGIGK